MPINDTMNTGIAQAFRINSKIHPNTPAVTAIA